MFLQQHSATTPEELKIIILQGLFDILMVYQRAILSPRKCWCHLRLPAHLYIKIILQARVVADSLIAKLKVETSSKAQESDLSWTGKTRHGRHFQR